MAEDHSGLVSALEIMAGGHVVWRSSETGELLDWAGAAGRGRKGGHDASDATGRCRGARPARADHRGAAAHIPGEGVIDTEEERRAYESDGLMRPVRGSGKPQLLAVAASAHIHGVALAATRAQVSSYAIRLIGSAGRGFRC
jgi:hypothetical protein